RGMVCRVLLGHQTLRRACEKLRDNNRPVHELYYCDLVANPEGELQQICKFLGISFASQMISLDSADLSAVYIGDHHQFLRNSSKVRALFEHQERNIPQCVNRKIERYSGLWHSQFPNWRSANGRKAPRGPSMSERCTDR